MSVDTEVSVSGGELFREQFLYKHPPVSQMKTELKFSDEDKAVLRHVTVSPWADYKTVPDYLGRNYVASVKLKPMPEMNEENVRKECRRAVEETYGGICEFIMKDNHTIGNNPNNLIRWTQIMREEIERKY
ncbi:MAG: hypothetical protein ACOX8H_07325 [Ruminococcus sp.]|jgi:hypothetical protein